MEHGEETNEQARLRAVEREMASLTMLVNMMKDDVHTIRNSIVRGLVVMTISLFGGVMYFVQQKDQIIQRLDRNYEVSRHEQQTSFDHYYGAYKTTPSQAVAATVQKQGN